MKSMPPQEEDPILTQLREGRMATGLSIPAFARRVGIAESTLRNAESGKHVAALPVLNAWAAGLSMRLILVSEDPVAGPWLIWSVRQHSWLAPDGAHTHDLWRAHRFVDQADVDDTLARINVPTRDKRYPPAAIAVLAPEAGRDGRVTPAEVTHAPALLAARVREQLRVVLDGV